MPGFPPVACHKRGLSLCVSRAFRTLCRSVGRFRVQVMPPRKSSSVTAANLIAPCGMNCALCSRYLAGQNDLKRSRCIGCRPRNQVCAYVFGRCKGLNHDQETGKAAFCFDCDQYPCKTLKTVDKRYRENYGMSFIENLESIRSAGLEAFLALQAKTHACPCCGQMKSVHNGLCFRCTPIKYMIVQTWKRKG